MTWENDAHRLRARIRTFIDQSLRNTPTESFDTLAIALHHLQAEYDTVRAALTVRTPRNWIEIPAVPVPLFQSLSVGTVAEEQATVVFRTSGTSTARPGLHRLRNTDLYDHGSLSWARRCVPKAPGQIAALLENPQIVPGSSLSHMVSLFTQFSPSGHVTWHLSEGQLDLDGLHRRLTLPDPLFLATTAFALASWLDASPPPLPDGSVLMVTGGFKGRVTHLDHTTLYARAHQHLRPQSLVTEYGMTELSSQLWGTPTTPYQPAPWLRALAIDPQTGQPLSAGTAGQLRFVDLCNFDSTVAIETLDVGTVHTDGTVTLHGRLEGAPLRGCSLHVEDTRGHIS